MHADLHDALPLLLGEPQCFSIIARALISRTTSPAHAGIYRHVFHEQTNLRKVHELCARIHDILARQHNFPCTREEHITPDLLKQFESHLSELMVLLRTLPVATEMQEMLRHEAMRLCKAKCPAGTDMVAHVRNKLDGLTSAFFVWGDESSEWLAAHELGHFLPDLVSEMPAPMRDRTMMAAEEYVKKVAENRSISLAALQEQLLRATTGAPRDAIHLQSQLRGDVLDVLGGQATLLRFFATPHDLRRMNDLKQLQPFVHFLRRTLVGEYHYQSYMDGSTAIMMQQHATVSTRASAGSEPGMALDILLGTGPDMARGPYAAYEWANCMHDVHSPPPPPMQLAMRDVPPLVPPRPRVTMHGVAQDASRLNAQSAAPPATGAPATGALAAAGVVGAIRGAMDTAFEDRMCAVAAAHRREHGSCTDHFASGQVISRLLDESPIPWDDVAGVIRTVLLEGPARVANAEDWERHGNAPCWLCERHDHPLNRCYRVFRLSDKGRAWAAKVQTRGPDSSAVTVADVCADCNRADTDYVCACLGTELDDDATFFERAIASHDFAIALRD